MTQRTDQIAGLIRDAVQKVITKGLHDPRIKGLITVTRVVCSDDLRSATVYVSIMPEEHRDLTMHGLRAAGKHIRHAISDQLALRRTPELLIKPDVAAARHAAVLDALAKVAHDTGPERADWGAAEPDSANNPAPETTPEPSDEDDRDDR